MTFAQATNAINDDNNALRTASYLQTSRSASTSSTTRKRHYVDDNLDDHHDGYNYDDPVANDMMLHNDATEPESDNADDADFMVSFRVLSDATDRWSWIY